MIIQITSNSISSLVKSFCASHLNIYPERMALCNSIRCTSSGCSRRCIRWCRLVETHNRWCSYAAWSACRCWRASIGWRSSCRLHSKRWGCRKERWMATYSSQRWACSTKYWFKRLERSRQTHRRKKPWSTCETLFLPYARCFRRKTLAQQVKSWWRSSAFIRLPKSLRSSQLPSFSNTTNSSSKSWNHY